MLGSAECPPDGLWGLSVQRGYLDRLTTRSQSYSNVKAPQEPMSQPSQRSGPFGFSIVVDFYSCRQSRDLNLSDSSWPPSHDQSRAVCRSGHCTEGTT